MTLPIDSQQKLVEEHIVLARSLARRYRGMGVEQADLEQESNVGLIEAAARFDPEKYPGVPFFDFARIQCVKRIAEAISYAGETTIPPRIAQAAVRCRRARSALLAAGIKHPTAEQVALRVGMQVVDVELALALPRGRKPAELAELPAPMPDQYTERAENELWSALEILGDGDRELIADRFGLEGRRQQGVLEMCINRGMSASTLKRRLDEIRTMLRIELVKRGWQSGGDSQPPKQQQVNFA